MTMITATQNTPKKAVRDLRQLFAPRSIAVIGASRREGSVGQAIVRNLISGGYTGTIYPVNSRAQSVFGNRCAPSVDALEEPADLAVVVVPAERVEDVVAQCADCGTRQFVIISAGFKEIGGEGTARENRLRTLAHERGLSILGPNCLGIINTDVEVRMNASFARGMPQAGTAGVLSQSGALCTALLDYAKGEGIGFSRFVSFGNKADVNEVDLLWSLNEDPNTRVILMYIEDLSDGQAFLDAASTITHGSGAKPIVAIKTGRTAQGAAAAASHTGSLAGSDEVYNALMSQAGVLRVDSVKELFDYARIFADPAMPKGRRTAIVTNAGGPGIMATDACVRVGLELAKFRDYTTKALRYQLPPTSNIKNPVDVIGDARHDRYRAALDAVGADDRVDQVVVIFTPQAMSDASEIAGVISESRTLSNKPIVACMMGLVDVAPGVEILKRAGIPTYMFPEDAMRSLLAKNRFAEWSSTTTQPFRRFEVDDDAVAKHLHEESAAGRSQLVEAQALDVLEAYGFSVVPHVLARTADDAVAAAGEVGSPVALKIASPDILHKSEAGGVILNVQGDDAVRNAFDQIVSKARDHAGSKADIWGVLVEKMLPAGKEVIIGATRDPQFGPLLMFGLGGIYTEVLRDVAFRVAPIRQNVAHEMVKDIRAYRLLEGVRGELPADVDAVAECLLRLSQFVTDHAEIKELDVNPLIVYPTGGGAVVADARIILTEN